jgi:hypothetical protein
MFINSFNHSINVFEHVNIGKASHRKSKLLKVVIPCFIFLHPVIFIMLPTIYLNDEFPFWTVKVNYVIADIFLPVELKIAYLFSPDFRPDKLFGIGHIAS